MFANIRHNKRLPRINHRGREKVNTQWNLYCMVHNIERLAKSGYAHKEARHARGRHGKCYGVNLRQTWRMTMKPSIENQRSSNPMHGVVVNWVFLWPR